MTDVLAISCDPGGADVVIPVVREIRARARRVEIVAAGKSPAAWERAGMPPDVQPGDMPERWDLGDVPDAWIEQMLVLSEAMKADFVAAGYPAERVLVTGTSPTTTSARSVPRSKRAATRSSSDGIPGTCRSSSSPPTTVSQDLALSAAIETFYRDGKQNLGLESYMLQSLEGAKRHLCLGFVAFTLLQLGARHPRLGHLIQEHAPSVGSMCQRMVTETARMFLLWSMKCFGAGHDAAATLSMAFMPRRQLAGVMSPM